MKLSTHVCILARYPSPYLSYVGTGTSIKSRDGPSFSGEFCPILMDDLSSTSACVTSASGSDFQMFCLAFGCLRPRYVCIPLQLSEYFQKVNILTIFIAARRPFWVRGKGSDF